MNKFTFALYFTFIASLLFSGCTVPTYLMNAPEPSPRKEIQQALGSWNGIHISQVIQKWGSPHEITGGKVGPKIYIWQTPVETILPQQEQQLSSSEYPNGRQRVPAASLSMDNMYELVFHTHSNGVIYKTATKRVQNSTRESKWKGRDISEVIRTWGSPHGIANDETGSKIYIYQIPVIPLPRERYSQITSKQRQINGIRLVTGTGTNWATNETYELMFYTDPNGVIYKTSTKRDLHGSAGSRHLRSAQEKPRTTK